MQKFYIAIAFGFSAFVGFIIYVANTGGDMPAMQLVRSMHHGDKLAHFMLFGVLSFLINMALSGKCFRWGRWSIYRGTASIALIAFIEEWSQHYIASRMFDYFDLLADLTGVLVFAIITFCYYRLCNKKAQLKDFK